MIPEYNVVADMRGALVWRIRMEKEMILREINLQGAYVVEIVKITDKRGFFARLWCQRRFMEAGLVSAPVQTNISFNIESGTLRGLHYQVEPFAETKLVRCARGAIYDVIIDLRPESLTFKQWFGIELTAENHRAIFIPKNFAHGYLTLEDQTEVIYQVSEFYTPQSEQGVRWNDPTFAIKWPGEIKVITDKDAGWPNYDDR